MTRLFPIRYAPIRLCGFLLALLCGCAAPASPTPTAAPSLTPTWTVSPATATQEATATPSLPPEFTSQFTGTGYSIDGASIAYTSETGEKITLPGRLDASGFQIPVEGGVTITIPADQLANRVYINRSGTLQIYSEDKQSIVTAYDIENKVWLDAAKYIHSAFAAL